MTKTDTGLIKKIAKRGETIKALQMLEEAKGGMITPYDVVAEASNIDSPLHTAFEWDNSRAGERYRLIQARIMLTTIKVEFQGENREAYFNATIELNNSKIRGYFPIERVVNDAEIKRQVLQQAIADLEYAQRKYDSLKELKGVINTKKLNKVKRSL